MKTTLDKKIQAAAEQAATQSSIKTPIFLFGESQSSNRQGKYFDGEDPYRENLIEFYSVGEGGKIHHEKQIYMITEPSLGTPPEVTAEMEKVYDEFRKKHPGHKVIVLGIEWSNKPLRDRIDAAILKYQKDHKAHKVLPAYAEHSKKAENER